MRIALLVADSLYWLAGNPAVAERLHSSAGSLSIAGKIAVQTDAFVNGIASAHTDRGNLATTVGFSTSRQFATAGAAETWSAMYDATQPRVGKLVMLCPDATYMTMNGCVVQPPSRQVVGCSVQLHYQVLGGLLVSGGALRGSSSASATLNPSGANNEILITAAASGLAGNLLSAEILAPASLTNTTIDGNEIIITNATVASVLGSTVQVTPGDVAQVVISGITQLPEANKTLKFVRSGYGQIEWTNDGLPHSSNSLGVLIVQNGNGPDSTYIGYFYPTAESPTYRASTMFANFPVPMVDMMSGVDPGLSIITPSGPLPVIMGVSSSAAQAISAINSTRISSDLVVASNAAGSNGTGTLAAVSATALTGGTDGSF